MEMVHLYTLSLKVGTSQPQPITTASTSAKAMLGVTLMQLPTRQSQVNT